MRLASVGYSPLRCITGAVFFFIFSLDVLGEDLKPSQRDVVYASIGDRQLKLDLYFPKEKRDPARQLIVWIHGGAWRAGSKENMPLGDLVKLGFPVASVEYRLSPEARFPAQLHDIKAAVRFLRASASKFGYSAKDVIIAGGSAGGHLALLAAVTDGNKQLEGDLGEHRDKSSRVQACIVYYGMSNLTTILDQSTPHGLRVRVGALQSLLGGQPHEVPELAKLASPVFHIDGDDPPVLLLHGEQDPQAPISQAHEVVGRYQKANRPCKLTVLYGSKHGGAEFYDAERSQIVHEFVKEHLAQ